MPIGKRKESSVDELYKEYEKCQAQLMEFRNKNRRVLERQGELNEALELAAKKIRDALRPVYEGKDSGEYRPYQGALINVVVTAKRKRVVDVAKLVELVPEYAEELVQEVVDLKRLDALIEDGKIAVEDIAEAITREPMTPSVSFQVVTTPEEG